MYFFFVWIFVGMLLIQFFCTELKKLFFDLGLLDFGRKRGSNSRPMAPKLIHKLQLSFTNESNFTKRHVPNIHIRKQKMKNATQKSNSQFLYYPEFSSAVFSDGSGERHWRNTERHTPRGKIRLHFCDGLHSAANIHGKTEILARHRWCIENGCHRAEGSSKNADKLVEPFEIGWGLFSEIHFWHYKFVQKSFNWSGKLRIFSRTIKMLLVFCFFFCNKKYCKMYFNDYRCLIM